MIRAGEVINPISFGSFSQIGLFFAALLASAAAFILVRRMMVRERELGRFGDGRSSWWRFIIRDFRQILSDRADRRIARAIDDPRMTLDTQALIEAGLTNVEEREIYYAGRSICIAVSIAAAAVTFVNYEGWSGNIVSFSLIVIGLTGPSCWLSVRKRSRQRALEREVPFILILIAAGSTEGSELVRICNRVADIMNEDGSAGPFIRELRRAQWYAALGSSWEQGLRSAQMHVGHSGVARSIDGIIRALGIDGSRHEALKALAQEAQAEYCMSLEERAAALPVRILMILSIMALGWVAFFQIPFQLR